MPRAVMVVLAILAHAPSLQSMEAAREVAVVNGVPITAREFIEAQRRLRFKFGEDWAALREAALVDCVTFQVTLQLAREHGVLDDTRDAVVRAAFAAENGRRAGAKASGGIVFGPVRLTWPQFRRYWFDTIERQAQAAIDRSHGEESEEMLRGFYAEHPKLFTAPGKAEPEPFEELRGYVRNRYRLARYQRLVREAVTAAKVDRNEAVLAAFGPSSDAGTKPAGGCGDVLR